MDIIARDSGGVNIVAREMAVTRYYAPATTEAATVEVYWRVINADGTVGAWNLLGTFAPGAKISTTYNPDIDQNVQFGTKSYSSYGVPDVITLDDALTETLLHQRETEAPVIGQNSPATTDTVEIGITGFTRFARYRRVTISANADMSSPLAILLFNSDDYASHELPRYFILQRNVDTPITTEGGTPITTEDNSTLEVEVLPLAVYLTVAHSGGTAWTPESNILAVTFTSETGIGGSTGDFDPTPRDEYTIN
jgi:hypothetical protein